MLLGFSAGWGVQVARLPQGSAFTTWARLDSDSWIIATAPDEIVVVGMIPKGSRPAQLEGWIRELPREQFVRKECCTRATAYWARSCGCGFDKPLRPALGLRWGAYKMLRVYGTIIQRCIDSGQPLPLSTTPPPAGCPRTRITLDGDGMSMSAAQRIEVKPEVRIHVSMYGARVRDHDFRHRTLVSEEHAAQPQRRGDCLLEMPDHHFRPLAGREQEFAHAQSWRYLRQKQAINAASPGDYVEDTSNRGEGD